MDLEYKHLFPEDFSADSRVWIYQSNRLFSKEEELEIDGLLTDFTKNWLSHGIAVKGFATLLFGQFIILMADESATGISGCSTDSSVRLIKEIENRFGVDLFDRTSLAFFIKDNIHLWPLSRIQDGFDNNFINPDTLYFNNLVQTKSELEKNWIIPIKESWIAKRVQIVN